MLQINTIDLTYLKLFQIISAFLHIRSFARTMKLQGEQRNFISRIDLKFNSFQTIE